MNIPKRVWMLWIQGLDHAPPIARACMDTWVRQNADWDVKILTGETLRTWVDPVLSQPKARSLPPVWQSDLARLNLLARHGGVWADATCYCMKPLDEWLPDCVESGFFAFARPSHERLMSSWFLASTADGYIPRRMWDELSQYFLRRSLPSKEGWRHVARRQLAQMLNRNSRTTHLWFTPPLPQIIGITPYGAIHNMFARLTRTDGTFRDIWTGTVKISADGPHSLQRHGLAEPPSPQILTQIEQRVVPVYKLNWRIDPATLPASSTLNVLLNSA